MTVTWKVRDGLAWSDGQPPTCDDFRYAWEWVLADGNVVSRAGFEDITDVECASDTDMIWHFGRIYGGYLGLAPLPRHALASIPIVDQVRGAGFRPG
jgi:ABC-type transport system substrate-binding protein